MAVRGVVNKFAVAQVHAGMRDLWLRLEPKYRRSPGCRSLRSTAITPLHAACISASRGISMPRCRSSICVNPEQSKPKLLTPPQVYVVPINRCASCKHVADAHRREIAR